MRFSVTRTSLLRLPNILMLAGAPVLFPTTGYGQTVHPTWSISPFDSELSVPFSIAAVDQCQFWLGDGYSQLWSVSCAGLGEDRVGRAGDGPGEFRWPKELSHTEDGLELFDFTSRRVISFNRLGTFIDQASLHLPSGVGGVFADAGKVGDRFYSVVDHKPRTANPSPYGTGITFWLAESGATPRGPDLEIAGPDYVVDDSPPNTMSYAHPRSGSPAWDFADGALLRGNTRSTLVERYAESLELDPDRIEFELPDAIPVGDAIRSSMLAEQLEAFEAELRDQNLGPDMRRALRMKFDRVQEQLEFSDRMPLYSEFFVSLGSTSVLFLLPQPEERSDTHRWSLNSIDGSSLARFRTPARGRVEDAAITAEGLLLLEVDFDDYPTRYLSFFPIQAPR